MRSPCGKLRLWMSLPQNMIIKPTVTQAINVAKPKISKNRLLGDFCLKSNL